MGERDGFMDFRDVYVVHYQRIMWLCQYHGFYSQLSFGSVNANISPVDLLLGYPANAILTWKNRKSLDPKVFFHCQLWYLREVFLAPSY